VEDRQDRQQAEEKRERMLFFRSGGELFALAIDAVEEVVVSSDLAPVPMAPPSIVGIVNHRGRIFTVLDFARLAGLGAGGGAGTSVFLHRRDMAVGFTVTSIEGIEGVPRDLLDQRASATTGGRPPFLRGLLDFGGRMSSIVDPEQLAGFITRLPDQVEEETAAGSERSGRYGS
jgi:chemotaxis signal transduction protein